MPAAKHQEVLLQDDDLIISKTCPKGKIRYANRAFMAISGFSEQELMGQPHNMIRHPDMPRGVFRLMWKTLQQGNEFFGFVKNRCADGSFYWVFANVTQDLSASGQVHGYYSVRRKPDPKVIHSIVEPLYQKMLHIETQGSGGSVLDQSTQVIRQWLSDHALDYNQAMIRLYQQGHLNPPNETDMQKESGND